MAKEAANNARDDMLIDEGESDQYRSNAIPEGFNANYVRESFFRMLISLDGSPMEMMESILHVASPPMGVENFLQSLVLYVDGKHPARDHVFSYAYPRLDMEVSKHMTHLLKVRFGVHPKTGRFCVPIDPNHCEEFDPTTVPMLSKLLGEINMGLKTEEWDGTSIGQSVRYFRAAFLQPLLKSCKEEIESSYSAKIEHSKNSLSW